MKILVVGGTGTVGSHVVRGLLAKKHEVRVLTRSVDGAASVPAGAQAVVASLEQPATLPKAFAGIEAVWLATALSHSETQQGIAAVGAARANGVRKIVYMSVFNLERGLRIPHFASKVPIQHAIRDSRLAWTFIQPNHFFQNDLWSREAITQHGIYPEPLGALGISRVDVRDIADASINALTEPGHDGKEYPLVGPDVLTGPMIAEMYSRQLGRDVRYAGDNLDEWEKNAKGLFPDWLLKDLKIMYSFIQKNGMAASPHDLGVQARVVGHSPRRFAAFVAEVVPQWRSAAARTA